jgi:putative exosortase-associated protein (TIGR04073 family)
MIRKTIIAGLIFLSLTAVFTAESYSDTAVKKLGRGIANVATCPFELTNQMQRVNNTEGPFAGATYGALKGVAMIGVRAVVGAYEIATFLIPLPRGYKPILKDPEFFFEETNW